MKKTLFLAAIVAACTGAYAGAADTPDVYQQWGAGTFVATDITVTPDNQNSYINGTSTFDGGTQSGGTNIGHCLGEGSLTITDGAIVTTPNNLYIGGRGYWNTTPPSWYKEEGHDGVVTVKNEAILAIGVSANTGATGARLQIGTSSSPSKGTLIADGGTILANVETKIGGGNSEGFLILKNGAVFQSGVLGKIQASDAFFQVGVEEGSSGHVVIDDSRLILPNLASNGKAIPTYTNIGVAGEADVTIRNGGSMQVASNGQLSLGAQSTSTATITVEGADSKLDVYCTYTVIGLQGEGHLVIDEGAKANTKNIIVGYSGTKDCSIINEGDMYVNGDITLNNNSTLITGTVTVTNRENEVDDGSAAEIQCDYDSHITFTKPETQKITATGDVTLGAKVVGGERMQYLVSADFDSIDEAVRKGLLSETTDSNVQVANSIGEYITAQYTTDEVNDTTESKVVSLSGGTAIIREGDGAHEGTIGSYSQNINETKAHIRMDETAAGSRAVWEGGDLKTLAPETTIINKDSSVEVTKRDSQLVVVEGSTLENHGSISADVQVDGNLKGSGKVNGTVSVTPTGHLVVGDAPCTMTVGNVDLAGALDISVSGVEKAADSTNVGWGSGTYSQLILPEGKFDIANTAVINVVLGGDSIFDGQMNKTISFDMAIVTGISEMIVDGEIAIVNGTLTENAVNYLVGNTYFLLTEDVLGIPSVEGSLRGISVAEKTYTLESDGTGKYALHLKGKMVVPEPATVTLSLLALAALAASRRRKH